MTTPPSSDDEIPSPSVDFDYSQVERLTLHRNKNRPDLAAGLAKARAVEKNEQEKNDTRAELRKQRYSLYVSRGLLVGLLLWFLLLQCQGLFLFSQGFLLTRRELTDTSECAVPPADITVGELGSPKNINDGCWMPKTFDKAIIIVIDALRYDFTVPESDLSQAKAYQNAFPFLFDTAAAKPHQAVLRPFIADPPTTTLQRLKALMAGTLPTFVDAGANFAGMAVAEDNLIGQLNAANKTIVHLGDDTWHSLFPDSFDQTMSRPFESFNVWDLHTLDIGVNKHLFPLLKPGKKDNWDVLIGHYLGVDHAGHRYGPDHPAMTEKLQEMNEVIKTVASVLDDDTLLVVIGDHGMDTKGDHGGESRLEVESTLWMYSNKQTFGRTNRAGFWPPMSAEDRPLPQVDFVPTLALLLGLPVPYSNLGAPMEEAFVGKNGNDFLRLAQARKLVASQVHRYMDKYESREHIGTDGDITLTTSERAWAQAEDTWRVVRGFENPGGYDWGAVARQYSQFQNQISIESRARWAEFDTPSMIAGILVLALTVISTGVYAFCLRGEKIQLTGMLLRRGVFGNICGAVAGWATTKIVGGEFQGSVMGMARSGMILGSAVGGILGFLSVLVITARDQVTLSIPTQFPTILSIVLMGAWCASLGSNSYVVWESTTIRFFLATIATVYFIKSWAQSTQTRRILGISSSIGFACLNRFTEISRLCRDEQLPFCWSTYHPSALTSSSSGTGMTRVYILYGVIPLAVAAIFPPILRSQVRRSGSYFGVTGTWLGMGMPFALLLAGMFWIVDTLDDLGQLTGMAGNVKIGKMVLAQGVLCVAVGVGGVMYVSSQPLAKAVAVKKKEVSPTQSTLATDEAQPDDLVWTVKITPDTRHILLPAVVFPALVVLSKPLGGGMLALAFVQILYLLEMIAATSPQSDLPFSSTSTTTPAAAKRKSSPVPVLPVLALVLIGTSLFYATGHSPVLSSIQWDSAFIPLSQIQYPWSPLFVILNTLAGPVLTCLAIPAVVMWRRPWRAFVPAPAPRLTNTNDNDGDKRKEVLANWEWNASALSDVATTATVYFVISTTLALASAVVAGLLRRHLMLFRVFCPRFLFQALETVVVGLVVALSAVVGIRRQG